jgi:hypothetical protein
MKYLMYIYNMMVFCWMQHPPKCRRDTELCASGCQKFHLCICMCSMHMLTYFNNRPQVHDFEGKFIRVILNIEGNIYIYIYIYMYIYIYIYTYILSTCECMGMYTTWIRRTNEKSIPKFSSRSAQHTLKLHAPRIRNMRCKHDSRVYMCMPYKLGQASRPPSPLSYPSNPPHTCTTSHLDSLRVWTVVWWFAHSWKEGYMHGKYILYISVRETGHYAAKLHKSEASINGALQDAVRLMRWVQLPPHGVRACGNAIKAGQNKRSESRPVKRQPSLNARNSNLANPWPKIKARNTFRKKARQKTAFPLKHQRKMCVCQKCKRYENYFLKFLLGKEENMQKWCTYSSINISMA